MSNTQLLIIIALLVLLLYYYHQNQQANLAVGSANKEDISKLESELQHYQNLYQKRVEKDIDNEEKITSLINLAKQKIKGKKDAEKLINNLTETLQEESKLNYQSKREKLENYFREKYPSKEQWEKMRVVARTGYSYTHTFSDADKELIWDSKLYKYGWLGCRTKYSFHLIKVDDLTELVQQIDENNWKTPEMVKKFGLFSKLNLEEIKKKKKTEEKIIEWKVNFLDKEEDKVYTIIDNLANQILARCIIVANRLTHGVDKESEENIMSLAFMYQRCHAIPEPKIFSELPRKEAENKLQDLVNQALSGDQSLLQKLTDLPYISQWVKDQLKDN